MLKKRFNGKYLSFLSLLLIAVCLSLSAAPGEGKWNLNPSDFRYDMSLYFSIEPEKFADLEKYEIGAFVDDECRGIAREMELPDGGKCLSMRIRSNVSSGEIVEFYVLDRATGQTFPVITATGAPFLFNADDMVGLPSKPFELTLSRFTLTVEAGENGSVKADNGSYFWGSIVEIEAIPDKGYQFASWSDGVTDNPRKLTIESDVTLSANFIPSSFTLSLSIEGELFEMKTLNFGDKIELPEAPEREGYSFSGWGETPEAMPDHDVKLEGNYIINSYTLRLILDDKIFKEYETQYGTPLNREDFDGSTPPEREGYTFAGWGEIPETMPARDLDLIGSYTPNNYLLTLILNGEVFEIMTVAYGEKLNLPNPPEQEGQTWDGWDNAPETMPAHDLEIFGDYEFNGYKLTLILDGELYEMHTILYGDKIELPEMPEREGYTFSGWDEVPATMPAKDLEIKGEYIVNLYKLTLVLDGEIYKEEEIAYGTELTVDQPAEKVGYTFSGWGDVLKTMPAHDVEIHGSYTANTYTLTLILDDSVYEVLSIEYGQKIEIADAPEREGYTFSGWGEVPATMPADNVTLSGEYKINYYKLTIYIDNEIYSETMVPFGQHIELPDPEAPEGFIFKGWEGEVPIVMPASDVEIYGKFDTLSGISSINANNDGTFTVVTLSGTVLYKGAKADEIKKQLAPGLYIINGRKVIVK